MPFSFKCSGCGQWHEGMPTFAADAPLHYYSVPEAERASRCTLSSDTCVVDGNAFFVRGCIEIPVHGEEDPFIWGVWVSLAEARFKEFEAAFKLERRSHIGPFFGWLSAAIPLYPDTESLKTHVHLRDNGIRPIIELEATEHPLAIEQRNGISANRVGEIYGYYEAHGA